MKLIILSVFCCLYFGAEGQYGQSEILPDLTGEELLDGLVSDYKADILFFDYGTARDTMFRNVYGVNDSLSCVYSGHTLYMDPTKDPTSFVYMNGSDNGINTEHTYPQSKGAGFGNARSDMHHLFPTRAKVNEERSNFPFGDIDDDDTDLWFYKDQSLFSKPTSNIDQYSEWRWQRFEPREAHKGNVARAVMYFYTMYKDQADDADPDFFAGMINTLCQWHFQDPVDSLEYRRTNLIAKWQVNPNPFVLDCSLASRTYCDITDEACALAVNTKEINYNSEIVKAYFNPEANVYIINLDLAKAADVNIKVFDVTGKLLQESEYENFSASPNALALPNRIPGSGIRILQVQTQNASSTATKTFKISVNNG